MKNTGPRLEPRTNRPYDPRETQASGLIVSCTDTRASKRQNIRIQITPARPSFHHRLLRYNFLRKGNYSNDVNFQMFYFINIVTVDLCLHSANQDSSQQLFESLLQKSSAFFPNSPSAHTRRKYSKSSLIRLHLVRMSDNPDRNRKSGKFSS
jgi:hypothetical protein